MAEKNCILPENTATSMQHVATPGVHMHQQPPGVYIQQQPLGGFQPPQSIVVQVHQRLQPRRHENYNSDLSRKLGIAQLTVGGLALVFNVIGIVINATVPYSFSGSSTGYGYHSGSYYYYANISYYVSSGIWCPLFFFSLSGAFALCAAHKKTKCMIVTNMVLSIISSLFAFAMLGMAWWALGVDAHRLTKGFRYDSTYYEYRDYKDYDYHDHGDYKRQYPVPVPRTSYASGAVAPAAGSMLVSVLWLLASLVEVVACIWSAVICCKVMCCATPTTTEPAVRYTTNSEGGQPQLLVLDSQGRPVTGAQIFQAPGISGTSQVAPYPAYTNQPTAPAGLPIQQDATVAIPPTSAGDTLSQPPPYQQ